ncbi:KAP family P-loop domain protein [Flaviaesturariibacter amylovorans]|uniref:KAP family P-loop domain protein n=2 Tax=Flaviaesturariibacter amylovorans TaxID=1084520 RepID=A0ABP8H5W6_9BACT
MILTDNETKVDLLNSEPIAQTIVSLLRSQNNDPITIGVHGDWGAGKSSVLEMIEAILAEDKAVCCIRFNGWRYQGFEDAKIALIEAVVTELIERRSLFVKAKDEVREVLKNINWLKVAKKTGSIALTAFTGVPDIDLVNSLIGGVKKLVAHPGEVLTKANLSEVEKFAEEVTKAKDKKQNIPQEVSAFQKSFEKLLRKAEVDQLVVLVDDLDRCLPDTAIETLEAIRLFMFTKQTAFVVAADEAMIEYAVRKHFPDLPDMAGYQTYTRNYLEKLIQVPFRIPILGEIETRIYVSLLLIGSAVASDNPGFQKLIASARSKLQQPWQSEAFDFSTVREAFGGKVPEEVGNAVTISAQIGPVLAGGTKGNPRQIKRFLNTLLLRHEMAKAGGFAAAIHLPALAKLMVAERFLPKLFEQIANLAAGSGSGICADLAALEKQTTHAGDREEEQDARDGSLQTGSPAAGQQLAEWLADPEICKWARLQPALGEVDLRPFLFVAKEKKDYFARGSVLGNLNSLIERMIAGSTMAAKASETEVKSLSSGESVKVFEALKSNLENEKSLATRPPVIQGLTMLVKHHPNLQDDLLNLLDSLQPGLLGAWVVTGWENVFTGKSTLRFAELTLKWANQGSRTLQAAAKRLNTRKH